MYRKKILASLVAVLAGGMAHTALADVYTQCATLGGTCVMTGTRVVQLRGYFITNTFRTGNFSCTNEEFGTSESAATCWVGPEWVSPVPTGGGENFPTETPPAGQVGYANVGISSYITGHITGTSITVKTFDQLKAAAVDISASAPQVILVSGTLRGSGVINIARFKLVRGLPGAVLDGFGLAVNGNSLAYNNTAACDDVVYNYNNTRNVVIQNLTFKNAPGIAISVTCSANHVWIDHNTIIKPRTAAISITRAADYVTASWNRIVDADKALLVGHENSARQAAQSKGHLHLTYHHNWHDDTTQTQSLTYYGTVHAFNNYIQGAASSYFLGIANDANIYLEGNSVVSVGSACKGFEGASRSHVSIQGDNIIIDQNAKALPCKVANDTGATPPPYRGYTYDQVGNVPAVVKQGAGAGKVVF